MERLGRGSIQLHRCALDYVCSCIATVEFHTRLLSARSTRRLSERRRSLTYPFPRLYRIFYFFANRFLKNWPIVWIKVGNLTTFSFPICCRAILRIFPVSFEAKRNLPLSVNTSKWRLTFLPETLAPICWMLDQGSWI